MGIEAGGHVGVQAVADDLQLLRAGSSFAPDHVGDDFPVRLPDHLRPNGGRGRNQAIAMAPQSGMYPDSVGQLKSGWVATKGTPRRIYSEAATSLA